MCRIFHDVLIKLNSNDKATVSFGTTSYKWNLDREKSKFFDYISDPVGDGGETQRDLDYQEAGTDIKLAIDYMLYSGFDLNGVIEKKAKTQAAKNLRNRIVSNEERVKSARKQQSRSTNVNFDDLDLGSILQ